MGPRAGELARVRANWRAVLFSAQYEAVPSRALAFARRQKAEWEAAFGCEWRVGVQ